MKISPGYSPALTALLCLLAGCSTAYTSQNTPHLSATQCSDLTALRSNPSPTRRENLSELAALRAAGYDPS